MWASIVKHLTEYEYCQPNREMCRVFVCIMNTFYHYFKSHFDDILFSQSRVFCRIFFSTWVCFLNRIFYFCYVSYVQRAPFYPLLMMYIWKEYKKHPKKMHAMQAINARDAVTEWNEKSTREKINKCMVN